MPPMPADCHTLHPILAQDPAGGDLFYLLYDVVLFVARKGPYIIIGAFVLLASFMAVSMIVDRIWPRRRK